ncbi:metallophosphoesterase [Paenibacillus sediminis]|uniref:3',5'-cyclic AMP phosphodiesterase CpdA n=1 Tax=Paenibacillus sediminis TaxID=664909 RepID=A0ABS4GYC2_9BACL|nr:metallophosphoesterase [Paenibacillus sediminis]MBP1935265.1 3',5'-cyclic AMP phosphodiesterase CpdA [Paenibacillus sediminis]
MRFAVMSDIHIVAWDEESGARLIQALDDYMNLEQRPDFIVMNGDLTDGHEDDYRLLKEIIQKRHLPPIYVTNGNHEYYKMWHNEKRQMVHETFPNGWSSEQAIKLFTSEMGLSCSYYDVWTEDSHLIFLSGEQYRDRHPESLEDAWISEEQFAWLEEVLNAHRNAGQARVKRKPIFVFLHQPLPGTVAGSHCPEEKGVVQDERFRDILSQYPEIILFSGHTHAELSSKHIYVEDVIGHMGTSSVRRPYDLDLHPIEGPCSESVLVEVIENKVVIKGRRHDTHEWLEAVCFERELEM